MIPYGKQFIDEDDIQAVVSVLKSDYLTQGPVVPEFEKAFAKKVDAEYAVASNSATSALHLACLVLGVGPGKIVWTSPISFVASSNCALYCGAEVDFVDIDPDTYNLSISSLKEKLELAKAMNRLPDVIIPVHLSGQSCDMKAIKDLSDIYKFKIIEDASHATGARYKSKYVGSCQFSDISIFSFHPVKIITSGEGGIATTNNIDLAINMATLRSHGITRDPNSMKEKPHGSWFYEQNDLGFNYRLTDISACLGLSQLSKLDNFIKRRHKIANRYYEELAKLNIKLPYQIGDSISSFHLFIIRTKSINGPMSHKALFERLRKSGINVNLHYIPIYKHPYYKKIGYNESNFPMAEAYYSEAISIPIFPSMTEEQQTRVINTIKEIDMEQVSQKLDPSDQGFQDLF